MRGAAPRATLEITVTGDRPINIKGEAMGSLRWYAVASMTALIVLVSAGSAVAAAPSNDTFAGATPINALPFSSSLDTTRATSDAVDEEANAQCGEPATEASVWYSFASAADQTVVADASASSYSAGVIVVTGAPGAFNIVACGFGSTFFDATAGQTYYLMAFDDTPGDGNGGTLKFSLQSVVAPKVQLAVDGVGRINNRTHDVRLTGTFSCSGTGVDSATVFVTLTQFVGRITIRGFGGQSLTPCDGATHRWSADVTGDTGRFAGGKAKVDAEAFACGVFDCADITLSKNIKLRG